MNQTHHFGALEDELLRLCEAAEPDWAGIKALIDRGADVNAQDEHGESILSDIISYRSENGAKTLRLVNLFLESGFDAKALGLQAIHALVFSTYDRFIFHTAKQLICAGAAGAEADWKDLLDSIGGEESDQRCCDGNHACENMYYALYELVDRASKGNYEDILVWHDCVGMTVDAVYADADTAPAIRPMWGRKYEMTGRIIFQCGGRSVVLEGNPNVYGCDRIPEDKLHHPVRLTKQLPFCIGATITDISFYHTTTENKKKRISFPQPHIVLTFDSGRQLHFTTNFGKVPKKNTKNYFELLK